MTEMLAWRVMETAAIGEVAGPAAGPWLALHTPSGVRAMQATARAQRSAARTRSRLMEALPDPIPRPPGRPPGQPIIIRKPPRPPEVPEVDGSLDDEDDPEIRPPPEIIPEKPPPPAPWERASRQSPGCRSGRP